MAQKEKHYVSNLKKQMEKLMPSFPIFKHADRVTGGIPDLSIHGNRHSVWIEVKRVAMESKIISKGLQDRTLEQLAKHSFCALHVIYDEQDGHTYVVQPVYLHDYRTVFLAKFDEFAHRSVAEYIKAVIENNDLTTLLV